MPQDAIKRTRNTAAFGHVKHSVLCRASVPTFKKVVIHQRIDYVLILARIVWFDLQEGFKSSMNGISSRLPLLARLVVYNLHRVGSCIHDLRNAPFNPSLLMAVTVNR